MLAVVCLASLVGIASSTNTKAQASELLATITTLLETEPRLALPVRQRKAELTAYYVEQGGEALWRLDVNVAGSGVTGDLLAHCIDTAMWLNGGIDSVTAMTETFIKERDAVSAWPR